MAEFTSAEKVNIGYENEYSTDAMTGGPDKRRQLYYQLIQSMKKAESVDIIVSFLMESGVRMLLKELEHTLKRGAKIRILTGNYLGITQPSALYLIKRKLGDRVDLRFYCEKGRSFHPAADKSCRKLLSESEKCFQIVPVFCHCFRPSINLRLLF